MDYVVVERCGACDRELSRYVLHNVADAIPQQTPFHSNYKKCFYCNRLATIKMITEPLGNRTAKEALGITQ